MRFSLPEREKKKSKAHVLTWDAPVIYCQSGRVIDQEFEEACMCIREMNDTTR